MSLAAPLPLSLHPTAAAIARFLEDIGIPVRAESIDTDTFLPGIRIEAGSLLVDPARLLYPGDLLHEAGHLALLPPFERANANDNIGDDGGLEMAAIAWSWAAALHLGLDPAVVFHDDGYKGGARAIRENFEQGRYIGLPLLQWMGLTVEAHRAAEFGVEPYPKMQRWLRP